MKYIRIYLVLVFSICSVLHSQEKIDPKGALTQENLNKWDKQIREKAPAQDALNAVFKIAGTFHQNQKSMNAYYWMNSYTDLFPDKLPVIENSIENYEKYALLQFPDSTNDRLYEKYIKDNPGTEKGFVALKKYVAEDINFKRWDSAVTKYKEFMDLFPDKEKHIKDIIKILQAETKGLRINNLGSNVNSPRNEWDPNPTSDGQYIYFSADARPGSLGGDDIWRSELKEGIWEEPENLGSSINDKEDETIDNISADGNTLMLSGTFKGTFGNFDIYSVDKTKDGWSNLHHYPYPINSEYTDEGGNITADRKAILFTSDRPGGIGPYKPIGTIYNGSNMGNMDVYVAFKTDSGWSEAINLGKTINTPYAERSPYLHPDGKTLYFSSDGHPGLGGLDVFKTVRLDETWTNWSKPVNLGKEINTILNDWGYKVGITGDSATFSGYNRTNGYGGWDIYSVSLPDEVKPAPVVTIAGNVTDVNGKAVEAEIIWENISTGEKLGATKSNPYNGHYFIVLPLGKNYGYYVQKEGYYPASENFDLTRFKDGDNIKIDITLTSIKEMKEGHKKVTINNIFFDFDSHKLKKESFPELDRLAEFIKNNQIGKLKIIGHTDSVGTDTYNMNLSKKRALSVKEYLEKKGSGVEYIVEGRGDNEPISDNTDAISRAKNRRVEIQVVE